MLPGKQVLIAPAWVRSVDWGRRLVAVEPTRDVIEEIIGAEIVDEFDKATDLRQLARQRRRTTVDETHRVPGA